MTEIIRIGGISLRFLQSRETNASLDVFEMTLKPDARMPVPHYHESWDEAIYGLVGTTTWRVDGHDFGVTPGESIFIRRGIVHGFDNRSGEPATCLCILTPGALGPAYFRQMAELVGKGPPDPARMKETMLRYGLVPAPSA
ncbi:MAG: cupin domain-containing protein [Methylobacteriaceae bacterium]|nr:cupin domain-containing protein [Methylobacteriaceae bacterium]MBV9246686.1 cupin domain-containing protein [Methylobacteriaceae bacterium]MBV9636266.1 cupin domain-containing protein [Methylobacteriaceae bacterium]MBV9701664.1 cupin domain-containing protein [Methylobacteriaceae bacterium]